MGKRNKGKCFHLCKDQSKAYPPHSFMFNFLKILTNELIRTSIIHCMNSVLTVIKCIGDVWLEVSKLLIQFKKILVHLVFPPLKFNSSSSDVETGENKPLKTILAVKPQLQSKNSSTHSNT